MGISINSVQGVDVYLLLGGQTFADAKTVKYASGPTIFNYTGTTYNNYLYIVAKARQNGSSLSMTMQSIGTSSNVSPPQ